VFLLSPANCNGRRAQQALSSAATFDVAARLRGGEGVPIGELFVFISGLYFRGKLAYARRFAMPPDTDNPVIANGVHVITANAGLRSPETPVTADAVRAFARAVVDAENDAYRRPLEQSARALRSEIGDSQVVLLGSIATPKYVDVLLGVFGERLCFPVEFVGRGDMSRGGLLLRHAASGDELEYAVVAGAVRHGVRPPKLGPAPCSAPAAADRRVRTRNAG